MRENDSLQYSQIKSCGGLEPTFPDAILTLPAVYSLNYGAHGSGLPCLSVVDQTTQAQRYCIMKLGDCQPMSKGALPRS